MTVVGRAGKNHPAFTRRRARKTPSSPDTTRARTMDSPFQGPVPLPNHPPFGVVLLTWSVV